MFFGIRSLISLNLPLLFVPINISLIFCLCIWKYLFYIPYKITMDKENENTSKKENKSNDKIIKLIKITFQRGRKRRGS